MQNVLKNKHKKVRIFAFHLYFIHPEPQEYPQEDL